MFCEPRASASLGSATRAIHTRSMRAALVVLVFLAACASRPRPPGPPSPRIHDSVPERAAAQRAATPVDPNLEDVDQQWGIDQARERKRQEQERKAQRQEQVKPQQGLIPMPREVVRDGG